MFDVPENSVAINSVQVSDLMTKLDVLITVRHKPKQNVFSFIIKGIERNVSKYIFGNVLVHLARPINFVLNNFLFR